MYDLRNVKLLEKFIFFMMKKIVRISFAYFREVLKIIIFNITSSGLFLGTKESIFNIDNMLVGKIINFNNDPRCHIS